MMQYGYAMIRHSRFAFGGSWSGHGFRFLKQRALVSYQEVGSLLYQRVLGFRRFVQHTSGGGRGLLCCVVPKKVVSSTAPESEAQKSESTMHECMHAYLVLYSIPFVTGEKKKVFLFTYMCVYIYIYIYLFTHTHTHVSVHAVR